MPPLRLGLAGGGTDLSPYCDAYGGAILNVTIGRYAFASILPRTDGQVVFEADDVGLSETFDEDSSQSALLLHHGVYERMIREFNDGSASRLPCGRQSMHPPDRASARPRPSSSPWSTACERCSAPRLVSTTWPISPGRLSARISGCLAVVRTSTRRPSVA